MNNTTRIRLRSGALIAVLLAVTLTAYAVQRMNGLQIGPNPSTTTIDLQSDGDIIATGDITAASFTGDGSGLTGVTGAGDVTGPASATDNAAARFDSTTGKLIQNSAVTIDDSGNIATAGTVDGVDVSGIVSNATHTGDVTGSTALTIAAGAVDIAMLSATGTPSSSTYLRGDNTWATITGGGDALTTNPLSQFAATTSAQLRGVLSDETGTGAGVFADSPTLVTPALGTPSALVLTNATGLPASSVGNGLTDTQVSDTLTASKLIGTGSTTDAVDLATAEVAGTLPDGNVSDTLTASLFVGSGSTTSAIDLATAEVAGTLPDSNVSDTLTASLFVGASSTTTAIDLATAEVAGDLPLSNIAQFAAGTFAGRALGGGTGDLQAMTNAQSRASLSNLTALTSTGNAVSWTAANASKFTHTLSENTTIGASTGADGQMVLIAITKASTYTFAWNAQFKALDGLTASIPAIPATAGDIGYYYFLYNEFLDDWVLQFHVEYTP